MGLITKIREAVCDRLPDKYSGNTGGTVGNNRGYLLVTTLMGLAIGTILSAVVYSRCISNRTRVQSLEHSLHSLYTATAGMEHCRQFIESNYLNTPSIDGALSQGTLLSGVQFDGGTYTAMIADNSDEVAPVANDPNHDIDGIFSLTVTGTKKGHSTTLEAIIQGVFTSSATPGFCARDSVTIGGQGDVDSYRSSLGAYGGGNVSTEATVGCNDDVTLSGQGSVKGDIIAGDGLSISGQGIVDGDVTTGGHFFDSGSVTGSYEDNVNPAPTPFDESIVDLVNAEVSAAAWSNDNANVSGSYLKNSTEFSISGRNTYTLPAGTYYFTKFDVSGQARVDISGNTKIIYAGSNDMGLAGQGLTNTSNNTSNLTIYCNTGAKIHISGQADFAGKVIAPDSEVKYTGQGDLFGAIIADEIDLSGLGEVHCDKDLEDDGSGARLTEFIISGWREL